MDTHGIPYSVFDIGYQTQTANRDRLLRTDVRQKPFGVDLVAVAPDHLLRSVREVQEHLEPAARVVGYVAWEQTEFPPDVTEDLRCCDEFWVPSEFVRQAIVTATDKPVYVVPHSVEVPKDLRPSRESFGLPKGKFLFLLMFDFGSYMERKSPLASIQAFRDAFQGDPSVGLVIKTIGSNRFPKQREQVSMAIKDLQNVYWIEASLSRLRLLELEAMCDAGISLHRAEGFGLFIAEMMAFSKPVVATGWSGNSDFMTAVNSYPVNFRLENLQQNCGVYSAGLPWASADPEHAVSQLKSVTSNRQESTRRASLGAQTIQEMYSRRRVGELIAERIAQVEGSQQEL